MVANITTGKDVYGALAYNQEKVDRGDGKVLLTHIVREPADGRFNVAATAEDLLRWMPSHYRTEKPVVHVSLNPAPEDRLDDGQLAEIAGSIHGAHGLGRTTLYRIQAYRHRTGAYPYRVGAGTQDGRKINDSRRNERSVAVTEELEREYGLHPAKGRRREKGQGIVPADYTRGDLKRQVAAVIKPAVATYRFQTLGEFRALLSLYNIGIEEVRGERNGTPTGDCSTRCWTRTGTRQWPRRSNPHCSVKRSGMTGWNGTWSATPNGSGRTTRGGKSVAGSIKRFGENPRRKNCANACGEPGWISTYDATKTAASWE